ncbi:orexin receptor type 2 [Patella vulgata]|uniref:orexin receptor type 2 n=1 Tax=Patella vulgata TaxID=6465 RepID=UPI0024A8DBF9|nr:orexin receptor type 2 [Patella vulgata]XP_050394120.2 orexin receptor type 2 [Patella vulgata]
MMNNSTSFPYNSSGTINVTLNFTEEERWQYLMLLDNAYSLKVLAGMIFLGILAMIGFFGNTLVLIVYIKNFQKSTSRIFILALAAFDLVNNIVATPGEIINMRYSYRFESVELCKMIKLAKYLSLIGSVFTLVAISIDRHRKICHPFKRQITEKHATIIVAVVAVASFVLTLPSLIVHSAEDVETDIPGLTGKKCAFEDSYDGILHNVYFVGLPAVMFIACFAILCVLYILVGRQIFHQVKYTNKLNTKPAADSMDMDGVESRLSPPESMGSTTGLNLRDVTPAKIRKPVGLSKNRTTLMLLSITIVFIASFVPYLIIAILKWVMSDFKQNLGFTGYQFYSVFLRSYFMNSSANPVVYSYWNKRFRQGCVRLLTPWRKRKTVVF